MYTARKYKRPRKQLKEEHSAAGSSDDSFEAYFPPSGNLQRAKKLSELTNERLKQDNPAQNLINNLPPPTFKLSSSSTTNIIPERFSFAPSVIFASADQPDQHIIPESPTDPKAVDAKLAAAGDNLADIDFRLLLEMHELLPSCDGYDLTLLTLDVN